MSSSPRAAGDGPATARFGAHPPGSNDAPAMSRRDRLVLVGLVAALMVVAVLVALPGGDGPVVETPGLTPGGTVPVAATYREGVVGAWSSLTPISARTTADREIVALVFSGLVKLGREGSLLPDLASGWRIEEKGARYTFTIRPDARWQDGEPVTSADVVFTFDTIRDPGYSGPLAGSFDEVTVTPRGRDTVVFQLATPLGGFMYALTQPLLPEHLLRGLSPAEIATSPFAATPVGSGPFRLARIDDGGAALVRMPDADTVVASPSPILDGADASGGSPVATPTPLPTSPPEGLPVGEFEFRFYPDEATLVGAYLTGEVDAAGGLSPDAARAIEGRDGSRILAYPSALLTVVVPNHRGESIFKTLPIRQALSSAIDRDSVVRSVAVDGAQRADGLIPVSSWAYDTTGTPPIAFDRSTATAALVAAGWKPRETSWSAPGHTDELTLALVAPDAATSPVTFAVAEQVAEAWRSIGFAVELSGLSREELGPKLQTGEFMLAVVSLNLGLDPDLYPFLASSQARTDASNIAGVQSVELDRLLARARRPGTRWDRRKAYAELQAYLSANQPLFPVLFSDQLVAVRDHLQGPVTRLVAAPGDRYWDVLTWRLADGR